MKLPVMIPVIAGILLLIVYIREKIKARSMKALYLKTAVSLCFIAEALAGIACGPPSYLYGALITGGLVCGLLGDVVLDLKYIDLEREGQHTKSGFVFFGIGHVIFMAAMVLRFGLCLQRPVLFTLIALVLGFAAGFLTTKAGPLLGNTYGSYFTIVAVYSGLLASAAVMAVFFTALCAFAPAAEEPGPAWIVLSIGFVSFLISDLVLSRTYFGEGHDRPADYILNYIFYYGAQFLIASSVVL